MCSDQGCQGDVEIGIYRSGYTKMCLMQCTKCAGLYVARRSGRILVIVDPDPPLQPLSEFEKAQETSLARRFKAAAKDGQLCYCEGSSPVRGAYVSKDDLPRDYVVEELVELIRSPQRIEPTAARRHRRRRSRSR